MVERSCQGGEVLAAWALSEWISRLRGNVYRNPEILTHNRGRRQVKQKESSGDAGDGSHVRAGSDRARRNGIVPLASAKQAASA